MEEIKANVNIKDDTVESKVKELSVLLKDLGYSGDITIQVEKTKAVNAWSEFVTKEYACVEYSCVPIEWDENNNKELKKLIRNNALISKVFRYELAYRYESVDIIDKLNDAFGDLEREDFRYVEIVMLDEKIKELHKGCNRSLHKYYVMDKSAYNQELVRQIDEALEYTIKSGCTQFKMDW